MRISRIGSICVAIAVASLAVLFASSGDATAASRICRQIEAQLVRADGGGSSRGRKYDAAIERQREQIAISRSQAREAGCGFALLGGNLRQCARINTTIDRMARNLDQLQRERGRMGGGGKRKSRAALLAALDANGCRGEAMARRLKQKRDAEVAALLREPEEPREEPLRPSMEDEAAGPREAEDGTYRTMCVRTCDGYFFPMSQASTVGDFTRDQKNCETACPGTEMQIFYGPNGTEDPGAMMSTASGQPYTALPTAFLHQNLSAPRPAGCGCNAKKNFEVIAGTPPPEPSSTSEAPVFGSGDDAGVPTPTSRPDASGETAAVEPAPAPEQPATSIIEIPLPEKAEPAPVAETPAEPEKVETPAEGPPTDRKVRVVGPTFLPDQAGAIDLQAPAPTSAR